MHFFLQLLKNKTGQNGVIYVKTIESYGIYVHI